MTYLSDDERVEAIKKWWTDNALALIAGVIIGLVAIFGWRYWGEHRDRVAGQASMTFEQLLMQAEIGHREGVADQARQLRDRFGSTAYAALGDLMAARALYESGQAREAMAALERVLRAPPEPVFASIAALRLARIQVAEGQLDAAAATVAAHGSGSAFDADFAGVRGDIAAARGDLQGARQAYREALLGKAALSDLIQLKLDNLPGSDA